MSRHGLNHATQEEVSMSHYIRLAGLAAMAVFALTLQDGASAESQSQKPGALTETITEYGVADWTNGVVRARGLGFPPKESVNALHAKTMTKRAAHSVALRNLLETIKGVRVDSKTTIRNYMLANDEITVLINGMVEGAKVINEQEFPDGTYEVTLEMDLKGDLNKTVAPKPKDQKPHKIPGNPKAAPPDGKQPLKYTGLVVDARGTGAQPALAPKILNEDGQEAYSVAYVEAPKAENGIVIYVPDLSAAEVHPRVTHHPLVVKAMRATGQSKSDLVISDADAQSIHAVPAHFRFLEKAQVLVVLDRVK
jgi:hypothetical protein